ncbi:carboxylesterase/lipase family protein [Micromonospora sp. LH3U1]|uniref:carboxylesterase/lipase family protein n=1 Tax=Micromonospora sp. LH3U1 TaxID=3018339 RepID=UPI0023498816|nr:carboxylesterase family protein [Micromonospora sp. LH3U1]WCN81343.1 carboxylesterase family protein [Micromonospora sp. LH3U1]
MTSIPYPRWVVALGAVALLAPAMAIGPAAAADDRRSAAVVRTDQGALRGSVAADHRSFHGIPYARPPLGALRWAPPQPGPIWTDIRDATRPGDACAQLQGLPMDRPSESENCLYLNVTTPRTSARTPRPVLVWLHGGDFRFGSGDVYGGQRLAAGGDVIVVTVNYRLGALGFLAHPALSRSGESTGNFGLQDQQAALRWVRRNAAAFGGDPGNVTLFGQSAGATSVCAQLAAPGSVGLFHRAIMQSNSCANPVQTRAEAVEAAGEFARRVGCTDPAVVASCLRGRDPARLIETAGYPGAGVDLGPAVDGRTLPVNPADALATGRLHPVPVLTGMNRDESRLVVWGMERGGLNCPEPPEPGQEPESCPLTDDQYRDQVRAMFGDRAQEVLTRYPRDDARPASETLAAVLTDHDYAEPVYSAALAFARRVPTFVYEFADEDAPFFTEGPEPTFRSGAYHCAELPYLFTVDYAEALTPAQRRLSDDMVRTWSDFARTGRADWPRLRSAAPYVRVFAGGGGSGTTDFAASHSYDFWRSLRS